MKLTIGYLSSFWLLRFAMSLALCIILGAVRPGPASAQTTVTVPTEFDIIDVGQCTFRDAIQAANEQEQIEGCDGGPNLDFSTIIVKPHRIILNRPVTVTGNVTIKSADTKCVQVVEAAYLTLKGPGLELRGIGFDANGAFQRSVIENDGGQLIISTMLNGGPCRFSNENKGRPVVSGGILVNRNGGSTEIYGGDFVNSSAKPFRGRGSQGGAINIESGTVTIEPGGGGTRFANDTADLGGAIHVGRAGTLNIESSWFEFINNRAGQGGGAIFSNGAVNIRRGSEVLKNASFTHNRAENGGAIYSDGGQLSVDGIDFDHNESDNDGGVVVSNERRRPGEAASIKNSHFHDNSAKDRGGAVYVVESSEMDVEGSTFSGNQASTGGAIYSDGGQLRVDGVEFDSNDADNGGAVAESLIVPPNLSSITNSYFHSNSATDNGGAVYVDSGSVLNVSHSTFYRDRAGQYGGGIYLDTGHVKVVNSTFLSGKSGNHGNHRNRGNNPEGIVVASGTAEATFSTIVAANLGSPTGYPGTLILSNSILRSVVCGTGVADDVSNLQWASAGCPNSIPTENPYLDPKLLANNGGPTPTIALLSGSPAIDAIPYGDCVDQEGNRVTTDQRGYPRPDKEDGPFGPCDIGAFEWSGAQAPGHRH